MILRESGALLRRIHDASTTLVGQPGVWQLPTHQPVEVICHNDVAPYNMVFHQGNLRGLIDFDTASPGPRIWDLAYLAYQLVPFTERSISLSRRTDGQSTMAALTCWSTQ